MSPSSSALHQAPRGCLTELLWDLELPARISHTVFVGFVCLSLAFPSPSACMRVQQEVSLASLSASAISAFHALVYFVVRFATV